MTTQHKAHHGEAAKLARQQERAGEMYEALKDLLWWVNNWDEGTMDKYLDSRERADRLLREIDGEAKT